MQGDIPAGLRFWPWRCMLTWALRWLSVPYAFVQSGQEQAYRRSISSYRLRGRLRTALPGSDTNEYVFDIAVGDCSGWPGECESSRSASVCV